MGRGTWIAAGAVAAALVATSVLLSDDDSPGVALADAAERIEGESMRQHITLRYGDSSGRYEITGEGISTADGSRMEFDMDVAMKGEGNFRMLMRNAGDEFWFRYPDLERQMPRGKRWVHIVDKTTAPTTLTPSDFAEFRRSRRGLEGRRGARARQDDHALPTSSSTASPSTSRSHRPRRPSRKTSSTS